MMPNDDPAEDSEDKPSDLRIDSALKLAKILAIVIPGCWALFHFLSFQQEANRLSLKQQDLATQQSDFNLRTQQAAEKANLAQITLAAQQAQFTLQTQQSQKDLREKELHYSVEEKRLENQAKKISLISRTTYRASRSSKIVAHQLQNGVYEVVLNPGIKNAADASFEVSMIIVDVYVGEIDPQLLTQTSVKASIPALNNYDRADGPSPQQLIEGPPKSRRARHQSGAVHWRYVGRRASVFSEALDDVRMFYDGSIEESGVQLNGFGTGLWKPGEEVEFQPRVVVNASPTDYVGFSVSLIINRGRKQEDIWWFNEYEPILTVLARGQ